MIQDLPPQQIEDLLQNEVLGRIGCYASGLIYIVPISFAYDGTYVYGRTREGLKIEMMRQNPGVCFEVDSLHDLGNWKSVIAWGEFEELQDKILREDALKKLHNRIVPMVPGSMSKLSSEWPFEPADVNTIKGVVFRIRLTRKTGKFENDSVPSFLAWG